jgi:hypothetical protein
MCRPGSFSAILTGTKCSRADDGNPLLPGGKGPPHWLPSTNEAGTESTAASYVRSGAQSEPPLMMMVIYKNRTEKTNNRKKKDC